MSSEEHACCASHCCLIHGCKYGLPDCPVVLGKVVQDGPCYNCDEENREAEEREADPSPQICPRCRGTRLVFVNTPSKLSGPPLVRTFQVKCLRCKYEGAVEAFRVKNQEVGVPV
jgi:hypothetical protein